jgi:hypothetical protein
VKDKNLEPPAISGAGVLEHLLIAAGVPERRHRPAADNDMNTFGLSGLVVV